MTPEARHRLYSGHAPEALAAVERVLAAPGPAPVLILAGETGCGRTGLLEAAAHGADLHGSPVTVLPLDLDAYEEGLDLDRFAEVQIARRWELDDEGREALRETVRLCLPTVPVSLTGAALVALLLRLDDPRPVWRALPKNDADARPLLTSLLHHLSREGHLVVHVVANAQLTDPLRRWLLDEAQNHRRVVLAISCSPADPDERVTPRVPGLRLDLVPFPAGALLDPVHELFDDLGLETADRLQRFLDLGALCGENGPAEVVFHYLGLEAGR